MPSTRTWLLVLASLIGLVIACVPPLMVQSFVGAQRRIGNRDVPRVAWIAQHETPRHRGSALGDEC